MQNLRLRVYLRTNSDVIESACIRDYEKFVLIDEKYYGGYQNWLFTENLKTKFYADRSCGVVAAANVAFYLSKYHKKPLYYYKDTTLSLFTNHIKDVSKFVCPKVYGVPTANAMTRGFTNFANSRGINIEGFKINLKLSKENIISDIKSVLEKNYPILMISWNSKNSNFRNHWITITGYYKDKNYKNFIITSNWGKKQIYSLDDWLDEKMIYKALVYFK